MKTGLIVSKDWTSVQRFDRDTSPVEIPRRMKWSDGPIWQQNISLDRPSKFIATATERHTSTDLIESSKVVRRIEPETQLRDRKLVMAGSRPIPLPAWAARGRSIV